MKKHSKIFQTFIIFTSFLFVMFFSYNVVNAQYYEASENKFTSFSVNKGNDMVTISFEYQNGIKDIEAYICHPGECADLSKALTVFKTGQGDQIYQVINSSNEIDTHTITLDARNITAGRLLSSYSDKYVNSKLDNEYEILVKARFCIMRSSDHTSCSKWEDNQTDFNGARSFDMQTGLTNSGEINDTIGEILTIINNIVIPVLWVMLGILLIVRGILLGIGIIKSSDEPEVRQKKISGLIWLGIGVGVSYVVTIAASFVMSMFGYGGYF